MAANPLVIDFTELLTSLALGIADQQALLEEDYGRRLEEFGPILREARAKGHEELARSVAPCLISLREVEIELMFRFAASRERQFELELQPLNLGYARRYAHSGYVENRLQFSLQGVPGAQHTERTDSES
jgi:hypothetical protein